MFPMFFMETVKLIVSLRRITKFLECDSIDSSYIENKEDKEMAVEIKDGTYTWDKAKSEEILRNIRLDVKKGELVAVIGKIGSGKSSLLSSILGEMNCKRGIIQNYSSNYSYVSQQAWMQSMSIKDNILFGKQEHIELYERVIEACALKPDFSILPAGDLTEIGEQGMNLSGGQKQRIALARAAYKQADVILLDDPLSAVDAHVAKYLFRNLIGPKGLLRDSTRVIVTHNLSFLSQMDRIILIEEGEVVFQGTFEEVQTNQKFKAYTVSCSNILQNVPEEEEEENIEFAEESHSKEIYEDKIIQEEKRQQGRVNYMNYVYYIKILNPFIFFLIVCFYFVGEGLMVGCNLILVDWTDKAAIESLSISVHSKYIAYYGSLNFCMFICSMTYNIWTYFTMAKASVKMHSFLIEKTMHAPLSFFESNPSGRIINRFTSDLEVIDRKIPMEMADVIWCCANIISVFVTISTIVPFILIALLPICICFIGLQVNN